MNKVYIVEVIRYGDPDLGVQLFGVFTDHEEINDIMKQYNEWRGGKYPEYYVTEARLNPIDMESSPRSRYNIHGTRLF